MEGRKFYAGLDQHHRMTRVIVIDAEEHITVDETIKHESHEQVRKELQTLIPKGALVAVEATGFWYWMVDALEDLGYETILVHAKEVAEIARTKKKSDRKDAFIMAKLAKDGRLHQAYKMPREVRPLRDLLRHRMDLTAMMTLCKNQTHAVLHKHGIWQPCSDLFGVVGEEFLGSLRFHRAFQHILGDERELIGELRCRLKETQKLIRELMPEDEIVRWLKTIPGIGDVLARVIRYEIWDIERFETFKHFQSYIGMAPATWQSADSLCQGGITHEGNGYVRWAMVQAAQRIKPEEVYLWRKFEHLKKHKGKNKARVAIACDLLQAVYFVWKRREEYRAKPAPPQKLRITRVKKEESKL